MKPTAKTIFSQPIHFFAFGFGSGLSPIAPGTMGTLVAVPIYWLLASLGTIPYIIATIIVIIVGFWLCDQSAKQLGVHDHPGIVWDEIAGYLVTMLLVPQSWLFALLGFVLFRLFDIWKPFPIALIDKHVDGGIGIMLDDILAGVYALLCLWLIDTLWL